MKPILLLVLLLAGCPVTGDGEPYDPSKPMDLRSVSCNGLSTGSILECQSPDDFILCVDKTWTNVCVVYPDGNVEVIYGR